MSDVLLRLGMVGIGKIARDRLIPALATNRRVAVIATAVLLGRATRTALDF